MMRQQPPRPDFDDALTIETAIDDIEAVGEYTELDDEAQFDVTLRLAYDATLLVTHIDRRVNYRACQEHGIEPPAMASYQPDAMAEITHDEHGTAVPVDLPLQAQQTLTTRQLMRDEGLLDAREMAAERLYQNVAETLLGVLGEGHYDIPITREIEVPVPSDDTPEAIMGLEEPPGSDMEIQTRRETVTIGHKRLNVAGVEVGPEIYWQTERQAVEGYYDRCERIRDEEMIAEDFRPYIKNPPEHVTRYPEESSISYFVEPVDWDTMAEELFISSKSDLTKPEYEELIAAIKEQWPEEALV